MFIKNTFIILLLGIIPCISLSQEIKLKPEILEKSTIGFIKLGLAMPKTEMNGTNKDAEPFVDFSLSGRHGFNNWIGLSVGFGKWLGNSTSLTSSSGNLAYQLSLGIILSITGSLIDKTKVETTIINENNLSGDNYNVTTKFKRKTRKNNFDGFRVSLQGSEFNFSKKEDMAYGIGGSIFYEQRLNNYFIQYGLQGDLIKSSNMEASLIQAFIGCGF